MQEEISVTVQFPSDMKDEAMSFLADYQAAINRGQVPHWSLMLALQGADMTYTIGLPITEEKDNG